ncbi:uncharacterized protein LOC141854534 [Brevipalpus obovatus]|uniref:uncharacterized protein LOC141854534 n=1 Tax=Brevipalpus obovatus TaxID=246614 RepID=UPI003D9E2520
MYSHLAHVFGPLVTPLFKFQFLLHLFNVLPSARAKGGAVGASAAAGGALASGDWTLGGNYTEEEMVVAAIVVGIIMTVSVLICLCQCYQKVIWEIEQTNAMVKSTKRPMPPAPYNRDAINA